MSITSHRTTRPAIAFLILRVGLSLSLSDAVAQQTFPTAMHGGRSSSAGGAGMATDGGVVFDNVNGQSFTAEETGILFDISFAATRSESTDADLRIDIAEFVSGQPGDVLGSVYLPAQNFETGFTFPDTLNQTASFANFSISITAGEQYIFLLSSDVTEANYRIYSNRSGYAGGDQLRSQNGSSFSGGILTSDLLFRVNLIAASVELGDCNDDGVVNFLDISPFIAVLSAGGFLAEADTNEDGVVDFLDISSFVAILSS